MVAALELIFTSSARYGVSAADLSSELQQLGLPREHSTAVARLHTDHCPQITAVLSSQSLRGEILRKKHPSILMGLSSGNVDQHTGFNALIFKKFESDDKFADSIFSFFFYPFDCLGILAYIKLYSRFSFAVSRLSSIEVLPCDSASPVSTVALKLKKVDGNEEDSTINISKDDVQVLLKGTVSIFTVEVTYAYVFDIVYQHFLFQN